MDTNAERIVTDGLHEIKEAVEESLTIAWSALEGWQRDNVYIVSGYRKVSGSFRGSAASLGHVHNETVNIYSHLLGSLLFILVGFFFWAAILPRYERASYQDVYVFVCFFAGAAICLGMSATYHTISNHSLKVNRLGNKLDYIGICFLIWGSFVPSVYYGFACEPQLIKSYWTMVLEVCLISNHTNTTNLYAQISTIGAGCAIVTWSARFATPQWRPFRAFMFVAMGLSAVVPVIHGIKLYGTTQMVPLIGLPWLVSQGVLYVVGAAIYAVCFA